MAAMTPEQDWAKKHDRSPLTQNPWQKMEDCKRQRLGAEGTNASTPLLPKAVPIPEGYAPIPEEDADLNTPPGQDVLSMSGTASLLRQEIQPMKFSMDDLARNFKDLDARFSDFKSVVEDRLQRMEVHIGGAELRVTKLEKMYHHLQVASRDIPSDIKKEVQVQMQKLHKQRSEADISFATDKRCLTAVQGLESLSRAQSWLTDMLSSVDGPAPKNIYDKGGFQGTIFAEFASHEDRDMAVALLPSAGINQDGNKIWATQDRAPVERAARNFCFGLKNLFKNVWGIPYVHVMDGAPYSVRVGGELALMAHVTQSGVKYEWHGEWATWGDLQKSPELKELMDKSDALVARASKGMKGSGKTASAGRE